MRRFVTALVAVVTLGAAAVFAPTAAANTSYSVAIGAPGFAFGYSNGYPNGGYVVYGAPYYYAPAPYYEPYYPYYYGPSVAYYGYYGPHYYHHHRYYRHY